jgi:hypothetical protein
MIYCSVLLFWAVARPEPMTGCIFLSSDQVIPSGGTMAPGCSLPTMLAPISPNRSNQFLQHFHPDLQNRTIPRLAQTLP